MSVMSPARKAAMSAEEFTKLLETKGISQAEAARLLGVHRSTVLRWADGTAPITEANTLLIRDRIRIPKKK